MKSTLSHTGKRQMAIFPFQLILLSFLFIAFTIFSTSLFAQGNTVCTAVEVQPGSYQANGPSTGNGARAGCDFTGATHADWYKFTPVADGKISVSSCAGLVNTRLSIFTGNCLSPAPGIYNFFGTCYTSDDNSCAFTNSSQITGLAVTGGITYYIQWDNKWSNLGFNWTISYTPINDEPCSSTHIPCGETINGTMLGATESDVTIFSGCYSGTYNDVFYSISPVVNGGTYRLNVQPESDMDPKFQVYYGDCDFSFDQIGCSNNYGPGVGESLTFTHPYNFVGSVYIRVMNASGGSGNFTISLTCMSDECPAAMPLDPSGGITQTSNVGSTGGPNNFICSSSPLANNDVWYKFTASGTGNVTIETHAGSISDTKIQIWDQCPSSGEIIACDDNSGVGLLSKIVLECHTFIPNHTYYVQVASSFIQGTFGISYVEGDDCLALPNDLCADAFELVINAPPQVADNFYASGSPDISIDCGYIGFEPENVSDNDVWFYFTAPSSGALTIETFSVGVYVNLQMQVFDACGGNVIACNEDIFGAGPRIILSCNEYTPGETYFVQVDGNSGAAGTFSVSVISSPCPANDECVDATILTVNDPGECPANQVEGNMFGASLSEPTGCGDPGPDVYYKFNSGANSAVLFYLNSGTAYNLTLSVFEESCTSSLVYCYFPNVVPPSLAVTPFTTYYLTVRSSSNYTSGTFSICIEEVPEIITVNGTVSGWNNNCAARDMQVSMLYLPLGTIGVYTTTLNPDGTFTISSPELLPGAYNILVKVDGALAILSENIVLTSGANSFSVGPVIRGDVNNNNGINILDYSAMSLAFNTAVGNPSYNLFADLNCDGVINILDVSIMGLGNGQAGDSFPTP